MELSESDKSKIIKALIKKATGYTVTEVVEEFVMTKEDTYGDWSDNKQAVRGELQLSKRKETGKHVPADLSAIKMLLGDMDKGEVWDKLTDEELEKLREKYLRELGESKG